MSSEKCTPLTYLYGICYSTLLLDVFFYCIPTCMLNYGFTKYFTCNILSRLSFVMKRLSLLREVFGRDFAYIKIIHSFHSKLTFPANHSGTIFAVNHFKNAVSRSWEEMRAFKSNVIFWRQVSTREVYKRRTMTYTLQREPGKSN